MAAKKLICPCCGAEYKQKSYMCEKCGSYVFFTDARFWDLSQYTFELKKVRKDKAPGIYVFGYLLEDGEFPVALGSANYLAGPESATGKLVLTNGGLSFIAYRQKKKVRMEKAEGEQGEEPQQEDAQPEESQQQEDEQIVTISLDSIKNVQVSANMFISQHITVSATDGDYKFVVYQGSKWVEVIKAAKRYL